MNCIDAMEGAGKRIIHQFHQMFIGDRLDDSEYIKNIRAVMESIDGFVQENPEITSNPLLLHQVLYDYSKELWLKSLNERRADDPEPENESDRTENEEYDHYYFDYIYKHGAYPL